MTGDRAEFGHRPGEQVGGPPRGVGVGQAVEPIAAQGPPGVPLAGQGIGGGRVRQAGVERGVKAGDGRDPGQDAGRGVDAGHAAGLVQRGQVSQCRDPVPGGAVHHDGGVEVGAAVHDPVADRVHPVQSGDEPLQPRGLLGTGPGVQVQ